MSRLWSRPLFRLVPLGAAGLLMTGCAEGPVETAPPSPAAPAAALCRALSEALPGTLDGLASRTTDPSSAFTAAWGDPALVLRCGGPRPGVLTPGHRRYDPTTRTVEVNGVQWLPEERDGGGYLFTTVGREANVELLVPGKYHPHETDPLVDLAGAVRKTVPTRL